MMIDEPSINWSVYILRCVDGTLYTGITNNLSLRLKTHGLGKGAKYTASRLPITLIWSEQAKDRSTALRRELEIKQLSRKQKLALIQTTHQPTPQDLDAYPCMHRGA